MVERALAIAAGLLAIWGLVKLRVYPAVAAGYRAKIVCTGIFGSGRPFEGLLKAQVSAESYWLLRPFRLEIDRANRRVTASLFGAFPRVAVYRPGLGATLVADQPLVGPARPLSPPGQSGANNWPRRSGTTNSGGPPGCRFSACTLSRSRWS